MSQIKCPLSFLEHSQRTKTNDPIDCDDEVSAFLKNVKVEPGLLIRDGGRNINLRYFFN